MNYIITFLEGIISFISPCMLPMLPIYISYFGGGVAELDGTRESEKAKSMIILSRAVMFVVGFTLVFTLLGIFAGSLGKMLADYQVIVNIICGIIVIVFGLSYLEVIHIPFFKGMGAGRSIDGLLSAFLFGAIYSISLTPCVGAFLGSALMLASSSGGAVSGGLLLLIYSLGLGIPFILSALLLDKLKTAFGWIKKNYRVINIVCGLFLIIVGVLIATGLLNSVLIRF